MTREEAKQLKEGDKIFIEGEVELVYDNGDIQFSCKRTSSYGTIVKRAFAIVPEDVTLMPEKPKYDPCRPFHVGDKVRRRKVLEGRYLSCMMHDLPFDTDFTVISGEKNAMVGINKDDDIHFVSFAMLELVTPVEELEPYSVRESDAFDIVCEGKIVMTIPFTEYDYYTFEQAKAAAEAEADRLNAEWRKEQSNG